MKKTEPGLEKQARVSGNTEWQVHKHVPSAGKTPVKIKAVPWNRNPRVGSERAGWSSFVTNWSKRAENEEDDVVLHFTSWFRYFQHHFPFIYHIRVLQRGRLVFTTCNISAIFLDNNKRCNLYDITDLLWFWISAIDSAHFRLLF